MRGGRKEYQTIADAMVESGMVAAGYTLLSTVCTGWQARDPVTHELRENLTNWPGGMKDFAAYLHGKGMQLSVCECSVSSLWAGCLARASNTALLQTRTRGPTIAAASQVPWAWRTSI